MSRLYLTPSEIEARSMEIIEEEIREKGISVPAEQLPVVRRVIHTTADFEYAENLYFSKGAVEQALRALSGGVSIVTDTNMAKSGVSRAGLSRLGGREVHCFMADPDVAERAKAGGTTRAVAAVEKASIIAPEAICAVGNAPTALFAIAEKIRNGTMRPALVIAVPVGFVNVVEAKEEMIAMCGEYGIPVIAARGRKGGSTVAAAICNALIYEAAGMTDPGRR